MTGPDPTREIIRSWLEHEASGELPDWVLDQTFERTRHQPQERPVAHRHLGAIRRSGRMPGRSSTMITITRVAAAIAIVTIGAGLTFSLRPSVTPGPGDAPAAESSSASPSAASELPVEAVWVHGVISFVENVEPGVTTESGGIREHLRDEVNHATATFDDERLSGTVTTSLNLDEYPQPEALGRGSERVEIKWGETRIENDDGAWGGTWSGQVGGGIDAGPTLTLLTGEGAYEGLSAMLQGGQFDPFPDAPTTGVIFPGDLPPDR